MLQTLLGWFQQHRSIKKSDVLRFAPNSIRKLQSVGLSPLIDELVQRGYVREFGNQWEVRPDV